VQRMIEPDPRARLASAAGALELLRAARAGQAPVTVARARPPAPGVESYLARLRARLAALQLETEETGEIARTRLALTAHGARRGVNAGRIHLYVTRAEWLEGAGAGGTPSAVALSLFAQSAGQAHGGGTGGWRGLLGARELVVPVVVSTTGLDERSLQRLARDLREPDAASVIPVLVDLEARAVHVLRPRSLLAGDPTEAVSAVRRIVDFLDENTAELRV
jgi:hypothetical protein